MNEMSDEKQQPPISKVQEGCDNRGFVMEAMKRWSDEALMKLIKFHHVVDIIIFQWNFVQNDFVRLDHLDT